MTTPRKLTDLAGNERLIDLLRKGRLPPSTLFSGPGGIGKKTAALLLAALGNCHSPGEYDLCGKCPSCLKTLSGNHPDIRLIEAEGDSLKIAQIRDLNLEAQYRPFEGRRRYFIVDEAERMTGEAANSILKTLEEPPSTTHIILISAHPDALLATIRSRCQTFSFRSLRRGEIIECLRSRGDEFPDDELDQRACFAGGSLGKALSLDLEKELKARDAMFEMLSNWLAEESFSRVFEGCEKLGTRLKERDSVVHFLETLQLLCYDLYYLQVGSPDRVVSQDRMAELEKLQRKAPLERLHGLLQAVTEAKRDVERYVNPLMCFETLWLKSLQNASNEVY